MGKIIGKDIEAGLSVEQTRGTAQSTAEKWLKNVIANITPKAEHAIDDASRGRLEDSDGRRVTKKWIEGDLESIVHADAIGYLLYNIYGAVSSSWQAAGVYQHTFTVGQSIQHPSLALFVKDGSVGQFVYNNAMINTLEITASVDEYIRFSASVIAADEASNSDTPSYDTEYDFIGKDLSIKLADTEAGLVGASATVIKDITISYNQGLIPDHVLGSYTPEDIYNGMQSLEITFSKNYLDSTFEDLFRNDNAKYVQITIQGVADIGSGNNPTIVLTLYKAQVTAWDRSGGNDELVTETVTLKAFYNASDSKQSQLVLTNNTAEYASAPSA